MVTTVRFRNAMNEHLREARDIKATIEVEKEHGMVEASIVNPIPLFRKNTTYCNLKFKNSIKKKMDVLQIQLK